MPTRRQFLAALGSAAATGAVWVPALSTVFGPTEATLRGEPDDPVIRGLLERHLRLWEGGSRDAVQSMRQVNPEWDFMGRTFLGLALVQLMARDPGLSPRLLPVLDTIIDATLTTLARRGMHHFLLGYGRFGFLNATKRSLFVDGELLAVVAARESLVGDGRFASAQQQLAEWVRGNMDSGPLGHGESYSNECWAFCNAIAAVGLQLDQRTSGRDHVVALGRYLSGVRQLRELETGMIHSEYTFAGEPLDGPEGSSLYLAASMLKEVDSPLGHAQYELARTHLLRRLIGFGYSREWRGTGQMDVDSGPIVPGFEASAGASGMALIATQAFGDVEASRSLLAALWATAFPTWDGEQLYVAASNQVGDAVLLYALVQGSRPLGVER